MFSKTTEYALRTAVCLAEHHGTPRTTRQIAGCTQTPLNYQAKVLQSLKRAGLVESQRGKHGGFVLTRHPGALTLLDVIGAVDPLQRITTCPLGLEQHGQDLCALHRRLDDTLAHMEKILAESTVAEFLADVTGKPPLCRHSLTGTDTRIR